MSGSGRGAWRRERACSAAKARSCAKYAAESPSVPGARVCPARKSASPNVTSSSDARSLIKASDTRAPSALIKAVQYHVLWLHWHCRPQRGLGSSVKFRSSSVRGVVLAEACLLCLIRHVALSETGALPIDCSNVLHSVRESTSLPPYAFGQVEVTWYC